MGQRQSILSNGTTIRKNFIPSRRLVIYWGTTSNISLILGCKYGDVTQCIGVLRGEWSDYIEENKIRKTGSGNDITPRLDAAVYRSDFRIWQQSSFRWLNLRGRKVMESSWENLNLPSWGQKSVILTLISSDVIDEIILPFQDVYCN